MNNNINVLFIWDVDRKLKQHFKKNLSPIKNINLIFPKDPDDQKLRKHFKDADVIVGWRPSKEHLNLAEKLKLYINPGTGIKHHIENFREINKKRKVVLVNGHGHSYATAQHAAAILLSLMNRIIPNHLNMTEGKWRMSDDQDLASASIRFEKRKIGLLGYGAINQKVHKFLSGFDNEFHILKRNRKAPGIVIKNGKTKHYTEKELHEFLQIIDILIIAIPHTSKTQGMIGKKELKLLGKNGIIVNVARGLIIDEDALYEALKQKTISGVALDVWYDYSPKKDKHGKSYPYKRSNPFHKLDNVILSPHRAASPFDELSRWDEVFENIKRAAAGRKDFLNVVDLYEEY